MPEDKRISRFAQRFVARRLEHISRSAHDGSGGQREYENNFVDGVFELMDKTRRPDLRRYVFSEAVKRSEYLRQVRDAMENGIRKTVWDGPVVETDEGRTIRGTVGATYGGAYRAGEISMYREAGPGGRVAFSGESCTWSDRVYAHKEHAIYAAREIVARTVSNDRREDEKVQAHADKSVPPRGSTAQKYGASASKEQDAPEQKRSR